MYKISYLNTANKIPAKLVSTLAIPTISPVLEFLCFSGLDGTIILLPANTFGFFRIPKKEPVALADPLECTTYIFFIHPLSAVPPAFLM